jgi:hypothetical protein
MFEELFNSSVLGVAVPDTSVEYPPRTDPDDWLKRLKSGSAERKQAFFGECIHLGFMLVPSSTSSQMNNCNFS